jgi:hypothetical protein
MSDSLPKKKRSRKVYTKAPKKQKAPSRSKHSSSEPSWSQSILPCFDCPWLDPNPAAADLHSSAELSIAGCLGLIEALVGMKQYLADFPRILRANEY